MAILQGVTINNTVVGGLVYKGIYDASTNQPSLANAKQGDFYKISVAGVQFGEDFQIGDMLLINADMGGVIDNAKIDKVDNTEAITDLNDLSDVTITSPANNEVLQYNGTNFVNATIASGGASDLDGLSDVTITTASNNQVLVHNGTNFVNAQLNYNQVSNTPSLATVATSGDYTDLSNTPTIPADLDDLSDVTITTASNNQVLVHNGTNFVNAQLNYNQVSNTPSLATVATSGDYTDLSNTPTIPADLDDLSDVVITSPTTNEVLQYNGTNFVNATIASGGASDLDGLSDVTITSVADGDTLVYNSSTSVFENIPPHMNIVELATTATSYTASPNDFVIIPDGHTGTFLYIRLPSTTVIGSTITVAVAGDYNFNTSKIIRCDNLGDQIFLWDALSNSGNYLEEVYLENLTLVKFTLIQRNSSTNHVWYADFGLSYPLPLELTRTSSQNNEFRLNITNGSLLQWTAGQGTVGRGAFKDVALNTIALSSFNNDLGLATVATSGDYTDLSNTPSIPADLNDLSDVVITSPATNEVLQYNGTNFVNATIASGGATSLNGLSDVTITGIADGDTLVYNSSTSVFENVASSDKVQLAYSAITAGTTTAVANTHYSVNTSGGQVNINLPQLSTVTTGTEIRVKVRNATNSTIITGYNAGSETIDSSGTLILTVQYQAVTLVAGSAEWEVI